VEAPVRRVNTRVENLGSMHWKKGHTRSHHFMNYLLRSRAV